MADRCYGSSAGFDTQHAVPYNTIMLRTQIQLPESDHARLREAARRLNRSISDCIREGIDLFLSKTSGTGDDFSDIAGRFKPLADNDDSSHDGQWAKAIRDSKRSGGRR